MPHKKRKRRKSKKRGGHALGGHRQSGERTAVSSVTGQGLDMLPTPKPLSNAITPLEKSTTISYGKTNITTNRTPIERMKDGVPRADSRTTMRLSMKRKLHLPSAVPRHKEQIYDLHGRPLLLADPSVSSAADGALQQFNMQTSKRHFAAKRHSHVPELAFARHQPL